MKRETYVKKQDTLEQAIRMLVRVAGKMRKEGIELRFTMQCIPCEVLRIDPKPAGDAK